MSSTSERDFPPSVIAKMLNEVKPKNLIDQLKFEKRDEILSRLASLLGMAYQKGFDSKSPPQVQQRWFTVCGYLAQVMARVVRDLEYEKLRADVEGLKKQVSGEIVPSTRRTRHFPRRGIGKEKSRSQKPSWNSD